MIIVGSWQQFTPSQLVQLAYDQLIGVFSIVSEIKKYQDEEIDVVVVPLHGWESSNEVPELRTLLERLEVTHLPVLVHDEKVHMLSLASYSDAENAIGTDMFSQGVEAYEEGDLGKAATLFQQLLNHDERARFNLAAVLHGGGWSCLSLGLLHDHLTRSPEDALAHNLLWSIAQQSEALRGSALNMYRSLASQPQDIQAATRLAALTQEGPQSRSGDAKYVKHVFDELAPRFEATLVDSLGYRAPWQLQELVNRALISHPMTISRIFDLGCGSGLCGKIFRSLISPSNELNTAVFSKHCSVQEIGISTINNHGRGDLMLGVDISPKMVDLCKALGVYHLVLCAELNQCLADLQLHLNFPESNKIFQRFDMIIAADTFIYVGALATTFQSVAELLQPQAIFTFSIEILDSKESQDQRNVKEVLWDTDGEPYGALGGWGMKLLASVRFAHSPRYIELLAKRWGFVVEAFEQQTLRYESGSPILGGMYLLRSGDKQ